MERMKQSFSNIIFGVSYKIIRTIMPFVIRTIIIYKLGIEYAGLDSLFVSILQMLSLAELGFGAALTFSMYKPIAERDDILLSSLLHYFQNLYKRIGTIILIIGLAILPFLRLIIKDAYPEDINIYILYLIYLLNTSISYFLYAHSQALLIANQRSDIINKIHLTIDTFMYGLQILILFYWKNYYAYSIVLLLGTIGVNYCSDLLSKKICPCQSSGRLLVSDEKKEIINNVKSLVGHKISGIILNSADNIVISAFLGLAFVTIYSNYFYVINAVAVILSVCFEVITASIGNSIIIESREKNYKDFLILSDICDWIIGLCCVCLIGLYQPFMIIWVGEKLLFSSFTMILFVVYFYFNMIRKMTLTYKDAAGMWWADFWKPYVGSFCNIILNIIMVQIIGINGVVISSVISMSVISLPWGAWALHKYYFQKPLFLYYKKLAYHTLLSAIACTVCYFLTGFIAVKGIEGLFINLIVCMICGNITFVLGMFISKEYVGILYFMKRFIRSLKK